MTGRLGLSTPWAREAFSYADRVDVESLIPEGWLLGVSVTANRGQVILWLVSPDGTTTESERHAFVNAVWAAKLLAQRAGRVTTTYERDGYVIEPLDNAGDLNREGDPAFNGAFDKW